ncbi:MAG TPA: thiamine pyrophosphate-dependent enzyme, partial [Thermoanaerobaculia bacterium]|nr:thiamine pyrophosphate-dependent enzyme [Thermoanaerobaculia bacterium]
MTTAEIPDAPRSGLAARFASFVAERYPFALRPALAAFEAVLAGRAFDERDAAAIDGLRRQARRLLEQTLGVSFPFLGSVVGVRDGELAESTPGVAIEGRLRLAVADVVEACEGFLQREAIAASLTSDEKQEILRGMILTRATDNRLKVFFTSGEVRWRNGPFQGKGFRSLGQEAIYAAAIRLRRGPEWRGEDGVWRGDVIAPMIRDLGAVLAMRNDPEIVRLVLSAQMGKAGPPMNGKDLHVGELSWGIVPAMAPLGSPSLMIAGMAMAFAIRHGMLRDENDGNSPVALSLAGEGATSLGEWHEAINLAAVHRLPAIFCVQNNQTALSTPVSQQSAVRVFADKAAGYGIPAVTIDGTDPEAVAAAFAWAAERARAGQGPALIELVAMRMCGHAHHDDMLYLGKDPQPSWTYPPLTEGGYADPAAYAFWSRRDPIATYAAKLEAEGIIGPNDLERWKQEAEALVEAEARRIIAAPWPDADLAGADVVAGGERRAHIEVLDEERRKESSRNAGLPEVEDAPPFDAKGKTFLEAVMLGVGDALRGDPRTFVYGEDVGGRYGNAFLLLKPLLKEFGDRIVNSTLAEGGVLGVCIGAALAGLRPIGEMQFNDFVATGFNQLVNSAAKIRYRWGGAPHFVLRMPWGGLRHAGPYHSQNTEAWFYRTPGLVIVAPSTPHDARALMASCVAADDPVLYYEHIALYRDQRIKQLLGDEAPRTRIEVLDPAWRSAIAFDPPLPPLEPNAPRDPKGSTFLDAIMLGVGDALRADPRVFVY